MDKQLSDYKKSIKKVNLNRHHLILNSLGINDAYKYCKDNINVSHLQFNQIIKEVNKELMESLLQGHDVTLPYNMGKIELRKFKADIKFIDGKLKTNLPIDWNKTLELWYSDLEELKNKTLIRIEESTMYKINYNKAKAKYINKQFYNINFNRQLKIKLKNKIKEGGIEAFLMK